ncbi:VWA domain-containing protein [Candidatus Acetothermia bacterium]|nr:VWA domain-containing protein [Candidatus Acetothermia bacterium]
MRGFFTHPIAWLTLILVLAFVGVRAPAAWAQPSIQLGIVLDGSDSINAAEFSAVLHGFSNAIRNVIPHDGSIEITVVQFASNIPGLARVEIPPTVITDDTVAETVAQKVESIQKGGGFTPLASGLQLVIQEITSSPNFTAAKLQLINIVTDGAPNRNLQGRRASSGKIRKELFTLVDGGIGAGIDEIDAEGIGQIVDGNSRKQRTFKDLLCNIVEPQPQPPRTGTKNCFLVEAPNLGNLPPRDPITMISSQGFVILIPNIIQDFANAIKAKLNTVVVQAPIANAGGPYACVQGQATITLDGTGSKDPDNLNAPNKGIASFSWDLDNNGQFGDSTSATPETSCPSPGEIKIVKLRVTDSDDGLTGTATATIAAAPLCLPGKVDNLINELLQKGLPFKDLFIELGTALQDTSDELGEILSSIELDPTDADLQDALDRLKTIGSLVNLFHAFFAEIVTKKREFSCEIDVLQGFLAKAIDAKEFGSITGKKISHQLEIIRRTLDQLDHSLAAMQDKLQQADNALASAVSALGNSEGDKAFKALGNAQRSVDSALTDVDRTLHKQLSEVLQALFEIGAIFKIELNNRTVNNRAELSIGIEQSTLKVQGVPVRQLIVEIYTLGGRRIVQSHSSNDRVELETLMGPTRPNGVYLYVVKITDDDGRSWQSKLNKLIWTRH